MSAFEVDAVVVGSGPNGLAAAIALARAGLSVRVLEARSTPGGGARTEESTIPGVLHDVCSTVHPLGRASPFFRSLDLGRYGLEWQESPAELAHVLDDHTVVTLERSIVDTADQLGADAKAYTSLVSEYSEKFDALAPMILSPLRVPAHPFLLARFGLDALQSMRGLAHRRFRELAAGALLGGIAAHAMLPLDWAATASFGLVMASAGHASGWPLARGGSASITRALVSLLTALGGEIVLDRRVRKLRDLPRARAYLLDVTPRQFLEMVGETYPLSERARLERYRYGQGVFKMDWALRGTIPWKNPACARSATVHLAGDLDAIAASESAIHRGVIAEKPFVLLVQPTLFDPTRAPEGVHIAWAYCHVPSGSRVDTSAAIEAQIERYAPGFRDCVVARATVDTGQIESHNANYIGGDINGGSADLSQLFFRPVAQVDPYATALPNVFLCSSSTPPGGGVHGMCGYWAARSAAKKVFQRTVPETCLTRP